VLRPDDKNAILSLLLSLLKLSLLCSLVLLSCIGGEFAIVVIVSVLVVVDTVGGALAKVWCRTRCTTNTGSGIGSFGAQQTGWEKQNLRTASGSGG
jgi:hypothetical protein